VGLKKLEKAAMHLSVLLDQFTDHLHAENALAKTTRKNYLCRLKAFRRSLPPEATLSLLTRQVIAQYIHRVETSSAKSAPMHFFAIRSFTAWLKETGWTSADLCAGMTRPKTPSMRRDTAPDDAVTLLWEACDRLPRSEYKQLLAKAVFAVVVFGGLRRAEAISLPLNAVNLATGEVLIEKGKGNKGRTVFLPKEALDALKAYLKVRSADCRHNYLFTHSECIRVGYNYLQSLMEDLHTIAGIQGHYTPHHLRHAYASRLARNGVSLPVIQALLGHSDLTTTSRYLHTNQDDLRAVAHLASLSPQKQVTQKETAPTPSTVNQQEKRRFRGGRLR